MCRAKNAFTSHLVLVLAGGGQMNVFVVELLSEELVEPVEGALYHRLADVRHLGDVVEEIAPPKYVQRCQYLTTRSINTAKVSNYNNRYNAAVHVVQGTRIPVEMKVTLAHILSHACVLV